MSTSLPHVDRYDRSSPEVHTDRVLASMIERYERTGRAISVSFRELASWLPHPERANHLVHHYPAKLLAHIPHFFLSNNVLSTPVDTVLDSFCGSGTVLVEALF